MKPTIMVGNVAKGDSGFRVCRPTPLGNPFVMRSESDRLDVVENYRHWLAGKIKTDTEARRALFAICAEYCRGRNITLCCHCVPRIRHAIPRGEAVPEETKLCHADVIAGAIRYVVANNLDCTQTELPTRPTFEERIQARLAANAHAQQQAQEEALETGENPADIKARIQVMSTYLGRPWPSTVNLAADELKDFAARLEAERRKILSKRG